ncbi:TraR/DksA family transcriptional regulator [Microbaculum marinum]|uniref:TraR/DksA family transcriptional regulator n=1 Tax=Microbaculum marinum TaxID=1764581 RepID=A0AAW9S1D5_9HYPH
MTTLDIEEIRRRLQAELAEIEALSEASAGSRGTVTLDQQSVGRLSRMDALQGQAMAKASEQRRRGRISLIKAALQRIDEGGYGVCEDCGDDIPPGRLDIDPTVRLCVGCAAGR